MMIRLLLCVLNSSLYRNDNINGLYVVLWIINVWLSKQLTDETESRYPQTIYLSVCGNV